MGRVKDTRTLVGDDNVVLREQITTERQLALFRLHLQEIIQSVLNAQDPDVNVFTDSDKGIVDDAMVKVIYDVNDRGIVDAASEQIVTTLKASPGTINPGEAVYVTIGGAELVDNTFGTGTGDGVALDVITDLIPGRVLVSGLYVGDTSLWAPLDFLWLGPVPGLLTNTPPVAGEKNQLAALVLVSDPTNGVMQVSFSDIRNTDADFSIYNPGANVFITATDVQAALNQVEAAFVQNAIYHYIEEEAVATEAANVWTSKALLTVPLLPVGTYEWRWTGEANMDQTNRMIQIRAEENAVIVNEQDMEPGDSGNWFVTSGFKLFTQAVAGPFTLEVLFRRSANPGTASMRRTRISIKSV